MAHDPGHSELAAFLEQREQPLPEVVTLFQEFARRALAAGRFKVQGQSRGLFRPGYRYTILLGCSRELVYGEDQMIGDDLWLREDGVLCRKSWKPDTGDVYTPQPWDRVNIRSCLQVMVRNYGQGPSLRT